MTLTPVHKPSLKVLKWIAFIAAFATAAVSFLLSLNALMSADWAYGSANVRYWLGDYVGTIETLRQAPDSASQTAFVRIQSSQANILNDFPSSFLS